MKGSYPKLRELQPVLIERDEMPNWHWNAGSTMLSISVKLRLRKNPSQLGVEKDKGEGNEKCFFFCSCLVHLEKKEGLAVKASDALDDPLRLSRVRSGTGGGGSRVRDEGTWCQGQPLHANCFSTKILRVWTLENMDSFTLRSLLFGMALGARLPLVECHLLSMLFVL